MTVYYNDIDPYCCAVLRKNIERGYLPQGDVDARDIRDITAEQLVGYQHVHLFAGIGGFPLGMARAGYPERLRTLTGGFPCQDISNAGKQAGIAGERSGLWKEQYRLIQESLDCGCGFDYILIENVAALIGRGLDTVLIDLAKAGYDAGWTTLRASDFGAPHRRERVFIVAYPNCGRQSSIRNGLSTWTHDTTLASSTERVAYLPRVGSNARWAKSTSQRWNADAHQSGTSELADASEQRLPQWRHARLTTSDTQGRAGLLAEPERRGELAYPDSQRCEERDIATVSGEQGRDSRYVGAYRLSGDTQSRLGGDVTRLSSGLDGHRWPARPGQPQHEYEPSRVVTERGKNRVARLKALGNSIVPQCAEWIARSIVNYEQARRATESGGAA